MNVRYIPVLEVPEILGRLFVPVNRWESDLSSFKHYLLSCWQYGKTDNEQHFRKKPTLSPSRPGRPGFPDSPLSPWWWWKVIDVTVTVLKEMQTRTFYWYAGCNSLGILQLLGLRLCRVFPVKMGKWDLLTKNRGENFGLQCAPVASTVTRSQSNRFGILW